MKNAEMEIIRFDAQDVITTSNTGGGAVTGWFQMSASLLDKSVYGWDEAKPDGNSFKWGFNEGENYYYFTVDGVSTVTKDSFWQVTQGVIAPYSDSEKLVLHNAVQLGSAGAASDELKSLQEICDFLLAEFEKPYYY